MIKSSARIEPDPHWEDFLPLEPRGSVSNPKPHRDLPVGGVYGDLTPLARIFI